MTADMVSSKRGVSGCDATIKASLCKTAGKAALFSLLLAAAIGGTQVRAAVPASELAQFQRGGFQRPSVQRQTVDVDSVCPNLLRWMSILRVEYPHVDFHRALTDKVEVMSIPLFGEPTFSKYFGVPYESLDATSLKNMAAETWVPCRNSRQYGGRVGFGGIFLYPAWSMVGSQPTSHNRLLPELARLRESRVTIAQNEKALASLPADATGYDRARDIVQSTAPSLTLVWPTESAAFTTRANAQISRLAAPALAAKIDPLIAGATGYDGVVALKHAPQKYKELWDAVSVDQRAKYQSELDSRYTEALKPLLVEEHSKMVAVTTGAKSLQEGAQWLASYNSRYMQPLGGQDVDALATSFRQRRDAQLAAALPGIKQRVSAAKSSTELSSVMQGCCSLSQDREAPGFSAVQEIVNQKSAVFSKHDAAVAQTDAKKRALGVQYGQLSRDGGPSASAMYDALQGKLDAMNEQKRDIQAQCATINANSPQDPVLGVQCLQNMLFKSQGNYDQQAHITRLQRLECSKAVGKPGYICDYIVGLSVNVPLPPSMGQMMEGQTAEARFLKMQNGWMMMP
jgi:hypothetical protein